MTVPDLYKQLSPIARSSAEFLEPDDDVTNKNFTPFPTTSTENPKTSFAFTTAAAASSWQTARLFLYFMFVFVYVFKMNLYSNLKYDTACVAFMSAMLILDDKYRAIRILCLFISLVLILVEPLPSTSLPVSVTTKLTAAKRVLVAIISATVCLEWYAMYS